MSKLISLVPEVWMSSNVATWLKALKLYQGDLASSDMIDVELARLAEQMSESPKRTPSREWDWSTEKL